MKNAVLIHTDQQRHDSLGCTGNPHAVTPAIDALAEAGTLLSRHVVANCVCMPSRASLLTGLYPVAHGVWDNGVPLNRRDYVAYDPIRHGEDCVRQAPTIADIYRDNGYQTACFGKMHLTPFHGPAEYGYPETRARWRENPEEMGAWHGPYYGFQYADLLVQHGHFPQGHYRPWLKENHPEVFAQLAASRPEGSIPAIPDLFPAGQPLELHPTMWLAGRFVRYLTETRATDRPFLAFIGFPDPHHPFSPTREAIELFGRSDVLDPLDPEGRGLPDYGFAGMGQGIGGLTESQVRMIRRYTLAMIYQIDLAVGRICDALKDSGLWENTAVLFTSDHGDFLGDHNFLRKGVGAAHSLLHVPCILRVPWARLPERIERATSNTDVLPSLLQQTDIPVPDDIQGTDLFGPTGEPGAAHAFADNSLGTPESTNYTVYDDRYRYTCYPHVRREELFDHAADPGESCNLARQTEHANLCRSMRDQVKEHLLHDRVPVVGRVAAW